MKRFFFLFVLLCGLAIFSSCNKDDDSHDNDVPEYSIMIMQPGTDAKVEGDSMHIHIEFSEEHMTTVHHINVRIYNKIDNTEVYNAPAEAHIHADSGSYGYHDDFVLDIAPDADYILEAKVWGHEAGLAEVIEETEFHLNPM